MTTAIVCGGRSYGLVPPDVPAEAREMREQEARQERARLIQILDAAVERLGLTRIAAGDQKGADCLAIGWAKERGVEFKVYPADWSLPHNSGGPIRNALMIREETPDCVIAFPGSRGTRNCCALAEKAGVRVIRVDWA